MADGLFQDLLDPTNTPLQICLIHDITLDQLAAIITSDAFQQASAHLDTITRARAAAIESNTKLQAQSLQRTIAHDAYLAATDMDQANTARDPNRAAIKARYLETARKAISASSCLPRASGGGVGAADGGGLTPAISPSCASPVPDGGGAEFPRRRGSPPPLPPIPPE